MPKVRSATFDANTADLRPERELGSAADRSVERESLESKASGAFCRVGHVDKANGYRHMNILKDLIASSTANSEI